MRMHLALSSALALGCLSACASRPTQLIVEVTREAPSTEATYAVRGAAQGEPFDAVSTPHPLVWPGAGPATIAIVPENNDATRRALIELTTTSTPIFTVRRIVNGYVPGQLTRIAMHIGAPCVPDCLAMQSCEEGVCIETPGTFGGTDAGMGTDADTGTDTDGGTDAGVDAFMPRPGFVSVARLELLRATDFDVTEGGVSAVLLSTGVDTYDARLAMVSSRSIVPGYERVAHAHTSEAWMASGTAGLLHETDSATYMDSRLSLGVAAATNFAVLGEAGERIWLRSANTGNEIDIPLGTRCEPQDEWLPGGMGGLRAIAAWSGEECERFAVASSSAIWISDGSPLRAASDFAAECFVDSSNACGCQVTPPDARVPDLQFGTDIALGRDARVATTSDLGVRFPGSQDLRPLVVDGGARSVSIGALPGLEDRFMVAYVDATGAHLRVWGPDAQCLPPVGFDLPGLTYAKVRISDCIDGFMTFGVLQKGPTLVELRRLTCG